MFLIQGVLGLFFLKSPVLLQGQTHIVATIYASHSNGQSGVSAGTLQMSCLGSLVRGISRSREDGQWGRAACPSGQQIETWWTDKLLVHAAAVAGLAEVSRHSQGQRPGWGTGSINSWWWCLLIGSADSGNNVSSFFFFLVNFSENSWVRIVLLVIYDVACNQICTWAIFHVFCWLWVTQFHWKVSKIKAIRKGNPRDWYSLTPWPTKGHSATLNKAVSSSSLLLDVFKKMIRLDLKTFRIYLPCP